MSKLVLGCVSFFQIKHNINYKPVCQIVSRLFFCEWWNNYWKKTLCSPCLRCE